MSDNTNYPFGGGLANPNQISEKQFVLIRTDMSTAFTDDEYNSCIAALSDGNAVAVSFGVISGIVRQAQLVSKSNHGALTFSCTRNETVESWTVAATSPHTITHDDYDVDNDITPLVNTGTKIAEGNINGRQFELFAPSGGQFVLARSNMTTDFTNQEYQDCVDAVTAEQAVCVQFTMTGTTVQAQLTQITGGGILVFELNAGEYHFRYEVSPTMNAHYITDTLTVLAREYDIAPDWSSSDVPSYKSGTLAYHAGVLFRCKTNSPSSSWIASEWEATNVSKEITRILGEQNMVLKHLKTDSVVSYELNGNLATATITLPTDKTLSTARLDNGGAKNTFISASVENVIKKAKISLGGAGKVLSRVQLSGMISIDVKIDSSESQSGTDVLISSILLKIGEWGEWEEKNIPIDFSSITTESWSSSYRDSKPVRLVIDHSVTEFTLEDFNIQDDFVNQTLDIFIELGIEADKTTTSDGTGLID